MSLNGVDISGHDHPIDTRSLTADFVIVKTTEGLQGTIYNTNYRSMADGVLGSGKLLGFYHYANGEDPVAEADCFYESIRDYKGRAVPCLDWEGQGNDLFMSGRDVWWCETFMDRISSLMGSTCLFYTSKGICRLYDWSGVAGKYPLFGAEYAYDEYVYQGYEPYPWQSSQTWGAWGKYPTIHQYGYVNPLPNNGGRYGLDGDIYYGTREEWQRMCGGGSDGRVKVSIADIAARIHYDMVTDERNGYSQFPERWGGDYGGTKTVTVYGRNYTYKLGSFDCSSSTITACQLALQGTPYEGALDGATYTGDMREVFVNSGLFYADYSPAKRGDLYLAEGKHVAMCQDGGSDGVFGYDCLSEFNRNENGGATWGKVGDQDGHEAVIREYYDDGWNTVLHYNGKADFYIEEEKVKPKQDAGKPRNDAGLKYNAHVADVGWLAVVRDGQTAGTVGYGKRLEAITVNPPKGWELRIKLHIQNVGWKVYTGIAHGNETIIGQTGKGRAIECMIVDVTKHPEGDKRKLYFQVHQANLGWKGETPQGFASGTDGMGIQLEAVKIWMA